MNISRLRDLRAAAVLLTAGLYALAPLTARGQFASLLQTNSRYAGANTATNLYNGDTGAASSTSLNAPSYAVFDSIGNLYVSDTLNNCVRRIDTSGNISTVAGLRISGVPDTCNTLSNPTPTADQGLLQPTGLAIDSANTLYISDSQHNCIRSLPSGAVDTADANALITVAGTCSSTDTASVTPVPNGLAIDTSGNLYISIQDTAASTPVNQVLRHLAADPSTTVCYMAGQPSANVPNACAGVTGTVALSSPAGLAFDVNGNLFFADSGNNCVREIAALTIQQTAVGQCANDHSGNPTTTLHTPYGLVFSATASLYISESGANNNSVVSFAPGSPTLTLIAGLPNGAPGIYSSLLDGQSSLNAPLNAPLGLTTNASGSIYLADSQNNIIRAMNTGLFFPAETIGATSPTQTITFSINQTVNLSAAIGADYSIVSTTCSGLMLPATPGSSPTTCQATVAFAPSRPGTRTSALQLKDALSNKIISVALTGTGVGPLSLFNPGTVSSLAKNLRSPIAVSVDSAGNSYILEQGNASTTADVLLIPAGGGTPRVVVAQGTGLGTPTAMAVDGAGNIFVTDAALNNVTRFGADGSVNFSYVTGLVTATAITVDQLDNLYIAQGGSTHNVIEVYASGTRRVLAGSGTTANADAVPATSALFVSPSNLALGPNGLSISDAGGHLVYTIDSTGTIHIVAGNGTTTTTAAGQALGTALLNPVGLVADAAGDLYVSDEAANRIYEIYPVASNGITISSPLGTGATGYTGDGGPAPQATLQAPVAVGLDGSGDLIVVDAGNNALRELSYPTISSINFGNVVIGTTSNPIQQALTNAGNAPLLLALPFTTTDSLHYAASIDPTSTTCTGTVVPSAVCAIGYTFSPTALGSTSAQSNLPSNSFNSPEAVQFTGSGIFTQNLPFTLPAESEVYGQPFSETATLNLAFPGLIPAGSMTYTIAGETTCSISGPFPGTANCPAAESGLSVGTYVVKFTFTSSNLNYFSTTGSTTLTITPGTLVVTPANVSMTYGSPLPALPATLSGPVNGDIFLSSDTTSATSASPIGTYPITPTLTGVGLASLSNYNVTYNTGKLTVTPIPLTVTIANSTRPYGAANPTSTSTIAGAINGDTFTVTYSIGATATSGAGTYPVTATVTGASVGNYIVTIIPGTMTVTPIPLTVTVANAARSYGAVNPIFTSTITGAINGDTFTDNLSTTATLASPIGTYPITDALTGPAAANYTVTVIPGTLTIGKATVILSISANDATRTYGAANPPFSSTITGALNGDTFAIAYATTATAGSPAGAYPIVPTVTGAALGNYTLITANGNLTITPTPLTVAANSFTRSYGAANPVFASSTTGLLNGDTVTITYGTTATASSPVGTYPVTATVSGAALNNYALTTTNGTLTITPAALTVAANSVTRSYGIANPVFTGTTADLLNGDTVAIAYATSATAASPVGAYPIVPSVTGAALSNYILATTNGTLTITPNATSPLTVTVNNASRTYGAANPVFAGTINGLLNGDTVTVTYATSATAASPAGTYPVTATVSGGAATNYILNIVPGNLTVTPVALTVAASSATRAYGAANPVFTYTTTGLLNGDTVTVTEATSATAASPAGTYPIVPTVTGAAVSNYTLTTTNGTLTITPNATSPLTVTVSNASRTYGAANPVFTSTINGLLNGDTVTLTYATSATTASPTGTYPITITVSGSAAANYIVNVVPGNLNVTPAALAVVVNSATRGYETANPVFTSTTTGLLNGDTVTTTYSTTATSASPVGTYPVVPTVTGAALSNYTLAAANGTLTITPNATSPLTVTVNNASRTYGAANPVLTGTIAGLLNGDTVAVTYATPATAASPAGTYPITATVSGAAAANYVLNIVPGIFTITPAPTAMTLTTSGSPALTGTSITFTSTVTSVAPLLPVPISFFNGSTLLGTGMLNPSGVATFTTSSLASGSYNIAAVYDASNDFGSSSATVPQIMIPGTFVLTVDPPTQFIRGASTTTYTVTVNSIQNFAGPVTLSCAGLPADATCVFANPIVTLAIGGTATTTMTIVNTAADAKLSTPSFHIKPSDLAPITVAAVFPFELTGLGVFFAGLLRRKKTPQYSDARVNRSPKMRLALALLCTTGLIGLTGCACFTSIYQNYTVVITGTSSIQGIQPQSTSVALTIAQQ